MWITNLVALGFGVLYCYKNYNPGYLRIFPPYLLVSFGVEVLVNPYINNIFNFRPFADHQRYAMYALYNLFTLFEIAVFSWFLFRIIRSARIKILLVALLVFFLPFFIQSSYPLDLGRHFNDQAVLLESIIIIIPCLVYFKELFARPEPVDLLTEPAFWLVTGVFFYLATVFPLFLTRPYLQDLGMKKIAQSLYSINNFALSITYILFIKGYTCRIKRL